MTFRLTTAVLATALFSPLAAEAQLQIRTNGTAVRVHNAAEGLVQINVAVGGNEKVFHLPSGSTFNRTFRCDNDLFGFLQEAGTTCDLVVTVRACSAPFRYAVFPPERTQSRLGDLAITPEFLASLEKADDQEGAVKDKVKEIKEHLDRHKVNGRGVMKEDLDLWSKVVRRGGHIQENSCPGVEQSAERDVLWDNFYHDSILAIWVTGTRKSLTLTPWLGQW